MNFLEALARLYPSDRLLVKPGQLAPYESDGLPAYRIRPSAVVIPESAAEVIETVKLCYQYGIPFVARGSGTSLSGGSVPVQDGLLITLNRLNRILKIDRQERIAVVEPGVINLSVSKAVAADGLYYAPDPSSQQICTIGGNVAFNSGGAHCLKYGMTSNHVLAIKAVLPEGEVVELGSESVEGVGPDLVGLFVGSEGLFGVALEITLRLLPKPEKYHTVLAAYHSLAAAGDAVSQVVASGLLPGALEMMDRLAVQAAEAAVQAHYPAGAEAILIVELEGEAEQVAEEWKRLEHVIQESGAYEVRVARDEADRQRLWKGRKSAFSAVGRLSPDFIVQDGVVPRSRLGEALTEIQRLSEQYRLRVANVFHAGDGNLHPLILFDGREADGLHRAELLAGEILRMCIRFGGSITGEHGVGLEKRDFLPELFAESDVDVMWQLRCAMDPKQIANPGKMFPGGVNDGPAALRMAGLHPLERAGLISRE
jgi:glycolate oxidase